MQIEEARVKREAVASKQKRAHTVKSEEDCNTQRDVSGNYCSIRNRSFSGDKEQLVPLIKAAMVEKHVAFIGQASRDLIDDHPTAHAEMQAQYVLIRINEQLFADASRITQRLALECAPRERGCETR